MLKFPIDMSSSIGSQKNLAVVIPAYQPSESLLALVRELRLGLPHQDIIVVNDGSAQSLMGLFNELAIHKVDVLHHPMNMGKGQALKTAFQHFLQKFAQVGLGVVTADADGQHAVEDIIALVSALRRTPEHLHLGVRNFRGPDIPWRSKMGNRLTSLLFRQICEVVLHDTQTGLRAIPNKLLPALIVSKSKGYELELEMLLTAAKQQMPINQIPIKTIYENNNASSHFNPLLDSIKIYRVLFGHLIKS